MTLRTMAVQARPFAGRVACLLVGMLTLALCSCGEDAGVPDTEPTPADTRITAAPALATSATDAHFEFEALLAAGDPGPASFECELTGPIVDRFGAFAPCASPLDIAGLLPGNYRMSIRASTATSGTDPTPAEHAWLVLDPQPNSRSPLGINLNPITGYDTEWGVVDRMHYSSAWNPQCGGCTIDATDRAFLDASLDADGWPRR
ncbi:MAG: hypothetical protein L0271_27680, partial [Gemmatimonadetes bacterium]|nr:hypothetical protein [Gemmatimonadota bacterium]